MSDFFSGLQSGNIRFPDARINGGGPLPTTLSGPAGVNGDPDGRYNATSALLKNISPYQYEPGTNRMGSDRNYQQIPHRRYAVVPKLYLPSSNLQNIKRIEMSHPVDQGDIAFVVLLKQQHLMLAATPNFVSAGQNYANLEPLCNLCTINYILRGIQSITTKNGPWNDLAQDLGFNVLEADKDKRYNELLHIFEHRIKPFGICAGSEKQGGLHQTGLAPITTAVDHVTTLTVDGQNRDLVNLWNCLDLSSGDLLTLELKEVGNLNDYCAYTLNHYYKGTVHETFAYDGTNGNRPVFQVVPSTQKEWTYNSIQAVKKNKPGEIIQHYWHIGQMMHQRGRSALPNVVPPRDDSQYLRGQLLQITFAPTFKKHTSDSSGLILLSSSTSGTVVPAGLGPSSKTGGKLVAKIFSNMGFPKDPTKPENLDAWYTHQKLGNRTAQVNEDLNDFLDLMTAIIPNLKKLDPSKTKVTFKMVIDELPNFLAFKNPGTGATKRLRDIISTQVTNGNFSKSRTFDPRYLPGANVLELLDEMQQALNTSTTDDYKKGVAFTFIKKPGAFTAKDKKKLMLLGMVANLLRNKNQVSICTTLVLWFLQTATFRDFLKNCAGDNLAMLVGFVLTNFMEAQFDVNQAKTSDIWDTLNKKEINDLFTANTHVVLQYYFKDLNVADPNYEAFDEKNNEQLHNLSNQILVGLCGLTFGYWSKPEDYKRKFVLGSVGDELTIDYDVGKFEPAPEIFELCENLRVPDIETKMKQKLENVFFAAQPSDINSAIDELKKSITKDSVTLVSNAANTNPYAVDADLGSAASASSAAPAAAASVNESLFSKTKLVVPKGAKLKRKLTD